MTLIELLLVLAILALSLGIAVLHLRPMATPLKTGAVLTEGFLRMARLQAMATTSAYRVSPSSSTRLAAETAASCSATTWTSVANMDLELPRGVATSDTSWSVCFSSRGISNNNLTIGLYHTSYGSEQIEVLLGGTTRLLE